MTISVPVLRALVCASALTCSPAFASQPLPPSEPFSDLLPELAGRIAAAVAPVEQVQLVTATAEGSDTAPLRQLARELARLMSARGLRVVDRAEGAAVVSFTCSETLRERVCAADVRKDETSQLVVATRTHDPSRTRGAATIPLVLQVQPLFADDEQILDVVHIDGRLIVLTPSRLTMYERGNEEWRFAESRGIVPARPWPRDLRGRLRIDRTAFEAFLPGVVCSGELEPPAMTCVNEQRAWPVGIDNTGISEGRNYFVMPDGRMFYTIAALGPDAGARWLMARHDSQLVFLDERAQPLDTPRTAADDVVAVETACAAGSHVLLSSRSASDNNAETLRLFRVVARQLFPITPPLVLHGLVTALWPTPDSTGAMAVFRDGATGRYAAFQIAVACGR
jgi:hypothetical protein